MTDPEIDRRVDFGKIELHQHIVAGNAQLRRAKRHKRRHIETAHADHPHIVAGGGKGQLAAVFVGEIRFRHDADARQQWQRLLQDAALRERDDQRRGHDAARHSADGSEMPTRQISRAATE